MNGYIRYLAGGALLAVTALACAFVTAAPPAIAHDERVLLSSRSTPALIAELPTEPASVYVIERYDTPLATISIRDGRKADRPMAATTDRAKITYLNFDLAPGGAPARTLSWV